MASCYSCGIMIFSSGIGSDSSAPHPPTLSGSGGLPALLIVTATFALSLLLAACAQKKPLLIGFTGQLEGTYSDLGVQGRNGATLAVEHANIRGGVNGRPIRLKVHDDGNTPEKARAAVLNLHAEGVVAIIGHMTSAQTMAGLPLARDKGLIMISPTSSSPFFSGKDDLFFRVIPENALWAQALARHCLENDAMRTVVQITDMKNKAFAASYNENFARVFVAEGGRIMEHIQLNTSPTTAWDDISDRVVALAPDAVQVALSARDLAALARRLRLKAPNIRIYSSMWGYTDELLQAGGKAVENIIFAVAYAGDDDSPEFLQFQKAYRNRFGLSPNFAAALTKPLQGIGKRVSFTSSK